MDSSSSQQMQNSERPLNSVEIDIGLFHTKFGLFPPNKPTVFGPELGAFRLKFLKEELKEYEDAYNMDADVHDPQKLADMADALVDLVYVAIGTLHLLGISFTEVWDEVQRANISKQRAEKANDSKRGSTFDVIKPPGWKAPDVEEIVRRAIQRHESA